MQCLETNLVQKVWCGGNRNETGAHWSIRQENTHNDSRPFTCSFLFHNLHSLFFSNCKKTEADFLSSLSQGTDKRLVLTELHLEWKLMQIKKKNNNKKSRNPEILSCIMEATCGLWWCHKYFPTSGEGGGGGVCQNRDLGCARLGHDWRANKCSQIWALENQSDFSVLLQSRSGRASRSVGEQVC